MRGGKFAAHIREDHKEQLAQDHCRQTAIYASNILAGIGLPKTAYLAGLLHDAGKFKTEFNQYLIDSAIYKKPVQRGSVNHTFAGVRFILENYHNTSDFGYSEITAEIIAYAIGAHHGLFDCINEKQDSGFFYRQNKTGIYYGEAIDNFLTQCASREMVDDLFHLSVEEMTPVLEKLTRLTRQENDMLANSEIYFHIGLLERMLLSAVIEGDRRDTAEFLNDAIFPEWPEDMRGIWADCLERVERKLKDFPSAKEIDRAREKISARCAAFAQRPGGIYRLNVPTGGGKTLSGLRYGLAHAKQWNKSRIIFVTPLLSILDQNADVIRKYIQSDKLILEHHSNVIHAEETEEELNRLELLAENWNCPVVITTLVQFLNTVFSGKTGAIRRFHALCNSVIILDEVQTIPNKMLTLFNLAVNFLAEICGATIVLCSATQPCLERTEHPLLREPPDIVPQQQEHWKVFKRTEIQDAGCLRLEDLPERITAWLQECTSLLVVCNKKDQAAFLFKQLSASEVLCFHLSAAMCIAHRKNTLSALQAALKSSREGGPKVLCLSTQVIEAGVDVSFQQAVRLAAGMDSVIQTAGRCNRNAEAGSAVVRIVRCAGEKLTHLAEIRRGQVATIALLDAYQKEPERFDGDLAGEKAIAFYYNQLYRSMDPGYQNDAVGEYGTIFDLLADNQKYADANCTCADRYFLRQAFKLAGGLFQVFDQNSTDVIVPYQQGRTIRETLIALAQSREHWQAKTIAEQLEAAKPYAVSLYPYQLEQLRRQGALIELFSGSIYTLADGFYDDSLGFTINSHFWRV